MPAGALADPPWLTDSWALAWEADAWGESDILPATPTPSVVVGVRADQAISDGGLIVKDPADVTILEFNWDDLPVGVLITTSVFAITAITPSADTALTKDQPSIVTGSRKAQVRVSAGTLGAFYRVSDTITTNESPAQTLRRSIFILVEKR